MDLTNEIPQAIKKGILIPELTGYYCIDSPFFECEMWSGGFCQIYPLVKIGMGKKCIRLWIDKIGTDNITHIKYVASYFSSHRLKYVIPFNYYEKALKLNNGETIPGVVMDWVNGETLINYVKQHRTAKKRLQVLASNFYKMSEYLNEKGMAHGDLSGENIIVGPSGNLSLVDYDSFYILGLRDVKQSTKGTACYQHATRKDSKYLSANMDFFSQQVIYLSLLAIAKNPELVNLVGDKELLFSEKDLQNEYNFISSRACKEIIKIKDPELSFRLNELRKSVSLTLDKVQSICQYAESTMVQSTTKDNSIHNILQSIQTHMESAINEIKMEADKKRNNIKTSESTKPASHCPNCKTKYYKSYSRYCNECGKPRKL